MAPISQRARAPSRGRARHVRRNLRTWEATSDAYERAHAKDLEDNRKAWGLWRIPERTLKILGDVGKKRILEFGCGAARWASALARDGGNVVGIDLSARQLYHARALRRGGPGSPELVRANAEQTPFRDRSFDIVFCDWGAMTFCDPLATVPEVSRLLVPGGCFAFMTGTPWRMLCQESANERIGPRLRRPYFGLRKVEFPDTTEFQLPYGEWIRLFAEEGFRVVRLFEPRAPPVRRGGYLSANEHRWARSWPAEQLWKLEKL